MRDLWGPGWILRLQSQAAVATVASSLEDTAPMPEISRFFGTIIAMYYNDHSPPHFHVRYGDQKAIVGN